MSTEAVVPQVPEVPQIFKARREIPIRDAEGNLLGGMQVYATEGATQAEADQKLADEMAKAIENGTRKIREFNLLRKNGGIEAPKVPEGAEVNDYVVPEVKTRTLTDDERFQLAQDLKDPAKMDQAFDRLYEARTGLKPIDYAKMQAQEAERSIKLSAVSEAEAFSKSTPDFYGCAENQKAMLDFMVSRNLKWTKKNLDIAFRELKAEGLLAERPVRTPEPAKEPEPPRTEAREPEVVEQVTKPAERKPDRFPSTIRPSQASGATTAPKPKGPSEKEKAMMNPEEWRAYLESQGLWGK